MPATSLLQFRLKKYTDSSLNEKEWPLFALIDLQVYLRWIQYIQPDILLIFSISTHFFKNIFVKLPHF